MSEEQLSIWQKFQKHGLDPAHTSLEGLASVDMGLASVEDGRPTRVASRFELACRQHNLNPQEVSIQKLASVRIGVSERVLSDQELIEQMGSKWYHEACKFEV